MFEIDNHMGIVISGMTADARFLTKFMRNECLNYYFTHGSRHPCERLVAKIGNKSQVKTSHPYKRPFGVGLLIGAIDEAGTHVFETDPSGNYFEYVSNAIGDRNQSAKTYLEKHFATFANIGLEELIKHGIAALRAAAQDTELTEHNVSVGIVGGDSYKQLSKAEIRAQLSVGGDVEMMQQ